MNNSLEIRNLSKTYSNGVKALNDISITIENGMFGLLGPNGAGKSSLMRTIAMLQAAESGRILFNDLEVLQRPEEIRSVLGYLPQEFGVYSGISAWELMHHMAVLKGIGNRSDRTKQIDQLLHQTNLFQHRKKAVSSFSGGMRQRFGIAQALLGNPKLIIVDEPTAGLDPEERNRFLNLLSEIGEHVIVILSTHLVDDVQELCTQMAILNQGKILAQGNPQTLTGSLQGKIWARKIEKTELARYQSEFKVISSKLIAGKTKIHIESETSPGTEFEPISPSLEDFYFSTLQTQNSQP
ncbi:ABC transporter ATP-binding protein [Algoriphagus yeomjeoni]|uniref:ABC-type multidrug transport system ATPase subunit n=1 Tax=Algoriphagus yeomjeoni TaxID=291403 RepID=A0A327PII1_9BACT|nr:ABC transporter ATP-binding protein [Algoriphagus yeomjeoni]RAI92110.1 ABC-type multidrug transport system ATPase subunit [Algoriphagus yeomjeoni]